MPQLVIGPNNQIETTGPINYLYNTLKNLIKHSRQARKKMWVVDKYIQSAIIDMRICLKQHFPGENYEEISYYKGLSTDFADLHGLKDWNH